MRGQSYLDLVIAVIIMIYSFLLIQNLSSNSYVIDKGDDIYSSIILYDNVTGINYNTVGYLYSNLSKAYDICLSYYNITVGDCRDKNKVISYIVWDNILNRTVILKVKYK